MFGMVLIFNCAAEIAATGISELEHQRFSSDAWPT
jgi:hypothetical protein